MSLLVTGLCGCSLIIGQPTQTGPDGAKPDAAPVGLAVRLEPAAPVTDDVVTAQVSLDGQPIDADVRYRWRVDGVERAADGPSLDGRIHFDKGQQIEVEVARNGLAPVRSSQVRVANSPPGAPAVSLAISGAALVGARLDCAISGGVDPDGDPVTYRSQFTRDGQPTGLSGGVLPSVPTAGRWACVARADDGEALGPPGEASVPVGMLFTGAISGDTVWSVPVTLSGDAEVAAGAKLTLAPGASISGAGRALKVTGALEANGTAASPISLDGVSIIPGGSESAPTRIALKFVHIRGGRLWPATGSSATGSLLVEDSRIEDLAAQVYLWYPSTDCAVRRTAIARSFGFSIGTKGATRVTFENDLFVEQQGGFAIRNWARYDGSLIRVLHSSFVTTDRVALELEANHCTSGIEASQNFWGGGDPATMVAVSGCPPPAGISYTPTLAAPHAATPSWP